MSLDVFVADFLEKCRQNGLYRSLSILETAQDRVVLINGREFINFCSNNYLGLANDPRLKEAAIEAVKIYGAGSASSRLVCGTLSLHKKLEEKIASFKKSQAALVFNSGYSANLGIISSLADKDSIVFSDRLNHASIVDAIILSRAKLIRYNHNSSAHLKELLEKYSSFKSKFIVTDSVFSMDGDIAPLKEISNLARSFQATLIVDEAHATGVLGPTGGGLVQELGIYADIDVQMGTLSKAAGSFGAFVCADKDLIDYLVNTSRPFIYTTSLPPAVLAASLKAIEIIEAEPQRRERLWENIRFIRQGICGLGFDCANSASAIIPIMVKDNNLVMRFSKMLLEQGIFIQGIRPPTVPQGQARLRLTVTANHTKNDLEYALEIIGKAAKELNLI